MKLLAYGTAWVLVISQWNDLLDYYLVADVQAPAGAVIITILFTVILSVLTFKEPTKGNK